MFMKTGKKVLYVTSLIFLCISMISCESIPSQTLTSSQSLTPSQSESQSQTAVPTPSKTPNPTPSPSQSLKPTATPLPTPEILIDTNIPDVDHTYDDTYLNNSDCYIYEDENSIYCVISPQLLVFDKNEKTTSVIAQDCDNIAYYNGVLYFEYNTEDSSYIKSYDIGSGECNTIFSDKNEIYYLAVYDDKIYFTYNYFSDAYELCYIGLDGSGFTEIELEHGADVFCLYQNSYIYAEACSDGPPIYREEINGACETLAECAYWFFEIKNDVIFFSEDQLKYIDLSTGEEVEIDRCYTDEFVLLGQYVIYTSLENGIVYFKAYDIETRDVYYLLDISEYDYILSGRCTFETMNDKAYLIWYFMDDSCSVDQIVIEDGSASLMKILEYQRPE